MKFIFRDTYNVSPDVFWTISDNLINQSDVLSKLSYPDKFGFQPLSENEYPIIEYDGINIKFGDILDMLRISNNESIFQIKSIKQQFKILKLMQYYFHDTIFNKFIKSIKTARYENKSVITQTTDYLTLDSILYFVYNETFNKLDVDLALFDDKYDQPEYYNDNFKLIYDFKSDRPYYVCNMIFERGEFAGYQCGIKCKYESNKCKRHAYEEMCVVAGFKPDQF